jgi:hypothetical protein
VKDPAGPGMVTRKVNREARIKVVDRKVLEKKTKVGKAWDHHTYVPIRDTFVVEEKWVEVRLEKVLCG